MFILIGMLRLYKSTLWEVGAFELVKSRDEVKIDDFSVSDDLADDEDEDDDEEEKFILLLLKSSCLIDLTGACAVSFGNNDEFELRSSRRSNVSPGEVYQSMFETVVESESKLLGLRLLLFLSIFGVETLVKSLVVDSWAVCGRIIVGLTWILILASRLTVDEDEEDSATSDSLEFELNTLLLLRLVVGFDGTVWVSVSM